VPPTERSLCVLEYAYQVVREIPHGYDPQQRLDFARAWLKKAARRKMYYVFSDESWIPARSYKRGQYVKKRDVRRDAKRRSKADRPVSKRMTRFAPKVNSFAILTERKLRFWDMPPGEGKRGGVTAEQHSKLLKQVLGPLLPTLRREAGGRRIVFVRRCTTRRWVSGLPKGTSI
jgi:hypothetical protein